MQVSSRISQCCLTVTTTFLLLAGLGLTQNAIAGQQADRDITREELLNFDRFLDSHQAIEQDLEKHPELVNDPNYVKDHPELKTFLETHPGVREEVHENPRVFLRREEQFDKSGRDITRPELANFDRFLDAHPGIEQDLRKDPKLLDSADYLKAHPDLKTFLDTHPNAREEARENPRVFVRREEQFDKSGRDITRPELANFDRFLDAHPGIEQDLRKDPKLLDSADYLKAHPDLKTFLDTHPNAREEARENPRVFVRREERFDKSGRDITRQEVGKFDEFLDGHPQITHELSKDPSLIKNPDYLQKHPELNEFLGQHPRVREDITQNPRVFMRAEQRYEKRERARERRAAKPNAKPKPAAAKTQV